MDFASFWPITNPQSDFFEDAPIALYEFKTSGVGEYHYKIWDDSLRSRHFLGADHADGIEAILSEREDHSLHEFIDGDEPLHPFIDFNLPVKTLDAITSKLSEIQAKNLLCHFFRDVSLEIFSKWDKNTMTIADNEYIRMKKAILPKDGTIFDFMIHLPNDESEIVESPLLAVSESEIKRYNDDTNSETTEAKFELVEKLF
ncbi:hypothetical protein GLOIN_2v1770262 [Rhizophagus clarus]|uniref:Uncharacterized protein n=1 Tax=Rhizophagus clarus TaxID=94130 RepID=A0A8H3QUC9_9GLOM|nr:hypothetical protein GLOIN_2v1770262 [Rhizophagus clarus]